MPMSPRDRRALIIFGAVTVVAVAVFFLFIAKGPKKASTASRPGPQLNVNQPTPTPSPTEDNVQKAQVEVDGTVYTVAEGDSFDDGYRLVSINGSCASFTHNATSFTL